jgi:predicted lipoprotein with Yx(FWY)xxD motif
MKRSLLALPLLLAVTVPFAAGAVLPTVKTAKNADLGTVLVNSTGRTLYHFTPDTRTKVKCTASCMAQWPPLLVAAGKKPVAGPGLSASKLGLLERPDGGFQVTYNGMTLYRFAGDAKAGDANGEAVGGTWYAVSSAGKLVKQAAGTSSAGGGLGSSGYTTPTSTSPSSGGGGYDPYG